MNVVRTVVTSLPKSAAMEKVYRIDPAPTEAGAKPTAMLGAGVLSVDLAQLLADLDQESRRLIGPSAPPRG